jgi:hypothetical protein
VSAAARVLERVTRHAPFGLRLWDFAAGTHLAEGLAIELIPRANPAQRIRASVNPSGIYYALGLPGLAEFERGEADDLAAWTAALRNYRVEVRDPSGRFLPFAFAADLPSRHLIGGGSSAPAAPPPLFNWLGAPSTPPGAWLGPVPLFSAPGRAAPDPLAVVRAELRELGTERPAAWALVTASIDGAVAGVGLADGQGRALIAFPYPARSRPVLASPPPATNDFRWQVELAAHYLPRPASKPVPELPDLAEVLAQLSAPAKPLLTGPPPLQPLPQLPLEYRVPLTAPPDRAADGASSYLFVNPA